MKSQTLSSPINITLDNDSLRKRGHQQWQLLDAILNEYRNKELDFARDLFDKDTQMLQAPKFMDDVWYLKGAESGKDAIKFKDWLPKPEQYPLSLLMRVLIYEVIKQKLSPAPRTLHNQLSTLFSYFFKNELCDGLFCALPNQPFATFLMLEETLFNLVIQQSVHRSITSVKNGLRFFEYIPVLNLNDAVGHFAHGLNLPWKKQGITMSAYVDQFIKTENIVVTDNYYPPIPFETVSLIVKHAMPFLEKNFDELCLFFNDLQDKCNSNKGWRAYSKTSDFRDYICSHRETIEHFSSIQLIKINRHIIVSIKWLREFMELVKSACIWIIILTTGLRNIDIRNLRTGCSKQSLKDKDIYWLLCHMEKTNLTDVLPIPETTHKAIILLECIRWNKESTALVTHQNHVDSLRKKAILDEEVGMLKTGHALNTLLKVLPNHYGFSIAHIEDSDSEATAHCIRTTLAGFIGEHSSAAILLLRKLFGHKNALMPEKYLRNNKLIQSRRRELIIASTKSLALQITKNAMNGTVAGKSGEHLKTNVSRIKKQVIDEAKLQNESLNEVDLMKKLEERLFDIFYSYIHDEQIYAFITPMSVICMRVTSDGSDSPCAANKNQHHRKESNIRKAITDVLTSLPEPNNCIGIKCNDALMMPDVSEPLLKSFEFYLKVIQVENHNPQALTEQAEIFVNAYKEPLEKIFSGRMKELLHA